MVVIKADWQKYEKRAALVTFLIGNLFHHQKIREA